MVQLIIVIIYQFLFGIVRSTLIRLIPYYLNRRILVIIIYQTTSCSRSLQDPYNTQQFVQSFIDFLISARINSHYFQGQIILLKSRKPRYLNSQQIFYNSLVQNSFSRYKEIILSLQVKIRIQFSSRKAYINIYILQRLSYLVYFFIAFFIILLSSFILSFRN